MRLYSAVCLSLIITNVVTADIVTKKSIYTDGDTTMEGQFVWDSSRSTKGPGIAVFHAWKGPGAFELKQAKALASMGYVAFVADIYGAGVRPNSNKEAATTSGFFKKNLQVLRRRANLALEHLLSHPQVDSMRVGAIGYCFGGTTVLELARSGARLKGVVSFHGGLNSSMPASKGQIQAKILVLHGAVDPHAPMADVLKLSQELEKAGVDYYFELYGGAVHAFTNPAAGSDPSIGVAYDLKAARRSWRSMKEFFKDVLR